MNDGIRKPFLTISFPRDEFAETSPDARNDGFEERTKAETAMERKKLSIRN
ncbi:MAG: hypothetical protein ACYDAZ_05085 [Thermoplasmataceae archaeon]